MDQKYSFTSGEFRDAMGKMPTGVTVLTAQCPSGEVIGVTVNSFTSVSLNPPLISFCLNRSLQSLPAFKKAEGFAVNVLREDQSDLSRNFSKSLGDKWSSVDYTLSALSNPIIAKSIAVFECHLFREYECGDHIIFLGHVEHLTSNREGLPLVFFDGEYTGLRG